MLRHLLTQTATVYQRETPGSPTVDKYGNPIATEAAGVDYPARLEPLTEREYTDDRNLQVAEHRLFLPAEADVDGTDRVEVEGRSFEVVGPPRRHRGRRAEHHVELRLRAVQG